MFLESFPVLIEVHKIVGSVIGHINIQSFVVVEVCADYS